VVFCNRSGKGGASKSYAASCWKGAVNMASQSVKALKANFIVR